MAKKTIVILMLLAMMLSGCGKVTPVNDTEPTPEQDKSVVQIADSDAQVGEDTTLEEDSEEVEVEETEDVLGEATTADSTATPETPAPTPAPEVVEETIQTSTAAVTGKYHYDEAKKMLDLVNNYRVQNGLNELTWDTNLEEASKIRAAEASICWAHTRPDGRQWYTVSDYVKGENLAKGYDTAEAVFEAWLNSPSHKENILWPKFDTMYVSYFETSNGWFWSLEFGQN